MGNQDSRERYNSPAQELYSRDRGKRAIPEQAPFVEQSPTSASALPADQPAAPLSASLQRASAIVHAPMHAGDDLPASIKRLPLRRRALGRFILGVGLAVMIVAVSLLIRYIAQQTAIPSSMGHAAQVAATQRALDRSTQATQTATVAAPSYALTAQIPGPCGDSVHWSSAYYPIANSLACLADSVRLTANVQNPPTIDALSYVGVVFSFPGGATMHHYRVSLTFSALQTTLLTPQVPPCVRLELDSTWTGNYVNDGLTVCQDGKWSHNDTNDQNTSQVGRCAIDPDKGFTLQAQVDAGNITYSCNTTPIIDYKRTRDITMDHLTFTLNAATTQTPQSSASTVKISNFSYTPIP